MAPCVQRAKKAKHIGPLQASLLNDTKKDKDHRIFKKYTTKRKNNPSDDLKVVNESEIQQLLERLAAELDSDNEDKILETLNALKGHTTETDSIDAAIQFGLLPLMERCLAHEDVVVRYHTIWILTNVACGDTEQTDYVVVLLDKIVPFITINQQPALISQGLWVMANIAGESKKHRDIVMNWVSFDSLRSLIHDQTTSNVLENVAFLTLNLVRQGEIDQAISNDVLDIYRRIVDSPNCDCAVMNETCRGIEYTFRAGAEGTIQELIESKIIQTLVHHSSGDCTRFCFTGMVKLVVNLLAFEDDLCQEFIDQGALNILSIVMNEGLGELYFQGTFAIANVFASSSVQIQAAMNQNLLAAAISNLEYDDLDVQKEASIAICSFLKYASPPQVLHAFNRGLVAPFVSMLNTSDTTMMYDVLASLINLLEKGDELSMREEFLQEILDCGMEDRIHELATHDSSAVSVTAEELRKKMGLIEDDDETATQPTDTHPSS